MTDSAIPLRAAVVGLRMGRGHARSMHELDAYQVVGLCDLNAELAEELAAGAFPGAKAYTDYEEMLAAEQLDVVAVATPTDSHARLTIAAAEAGVRGICCEKPMATDLGDGRAMVRACAKHGVQLIVSHQRRMGPDLLTMRRLIDEGAIGEVYLLRGGCQGDLLSDGTHLIDSLRWLAGDQPIRWLLGQIYRDPPDPQEEHGIGYHRSGGFRYGHMVENGAMAVFEFESGLRAEMFTGGMHMRGRPYQDYEVFGSKGRLWRYGDRAQPPLRIQDEQGGGYREVVNDADAPASSHANMYAAFARTILEGAPHSLSGESGLADLEVIMAIFESARTHSRIEFPLEQEAYPLLLMYPE
ncbi:MAG TPA: Gfo/Idh/MocA family oxidoreductase [Anaerolineae bacterium]|nr:Gfo/Idh/MocA family oxidoreductase [Anaerolineae bacterium]